MRKHRLLPLLLCMLAALILVGPYGTIVLVHKDSRGLLILLGASLLGAIAYRDLNRRDIEELVEHWVLGPLVKALQALRGVRLVTAAVLAAEIGDFARFRKPPQLMAYLGLDRGGAGAWQ